MEFIHFEKQEASLCAQHAVNMLLQGSYFTAVDLAEIASKIDMRERIMMNGNSEKSQNYDDSGFFSVQVIAEALKVFSLELIPLNSSRAAAYRNNPTLGQAYICNLNQHWFAVRRIGLQWFTLNSLLSTPKLITDTYLNLFFAQLIQSGYSIFLVDGTLPLCIADERLLHFPVDPSLAGKSDLYPVPTTFSNSEPIPKEMDDEDEDLQLALTLSRQAMGGSKPTKAMTDEMVNAGNHGNWNDSDDEALQNQLKEAIRLSMESYKEENVAGPSKVLPNVVGLNEAPITDENKSDSFIPPGEEIRKKRENFLKRFPM
ncbi:unnamed protein product [Thelazia callipaeda]|uniref:Ataxin-3 homolog n=1 Tax=Thelazia callipaeda TaxID=103827 RepID=A0A0N5D710_THECL|nr:unnamed protein product [Thelazia callipaeda]